MVPADASGEGRGSLPWLVPDRVGWLSGSHESDVVVSSRVRLARNIAGFRFATRSDPSDRRAVHELLRERVIGARLLLSGETPARLAWVDVHRLCRIDRDLLVERHLISPHHARGLGGSPQDAETDPRAVAVSLPDERLSIMVNEEDHLRMQLLLPGLSLAQAAAELDAADDAIERTVDYAYSPRFGYLTACPTNVGTGIRLSVMLHLPGLRMLGEIDKVKRAASDMSLAVRGFWGEGSEAEGDFYQISNQTTLGRTESVMLDSLEKRIIPRVIEYERRARERLMQQRRAVIEDVVFRALGTLTHARRMATSEAMQRLSELRLGTVCGLVDRRLVETIGQLLLIVHPAHLQRAIGAEIGQDERRVARATLLRTRLVAALEGRLGER